MYIIIPTGSRSLFSQTFQLFDIFCLSRAVLSLTSEISAEKSRLFHARALKNSPGSTDVSHCNSCSWASLACPTAKTRLFKAAFWGGSLPKRWTCFMSVQNL